MTIIVYNPRYINPAEIARLLRDLEDRGVLATTVTHMNDNHKPLYIETVVETKQ